MDLDQEHLPTSSMLQEGMDDPFYAIRQNRNTKLENQQQVLCHLKYGCILTC